MRRRSNRESGAILIVFMVTLAVAAIALGAAVQAWSTTWRRENEEELIFRANQYVDGIIAYRKEHGGMFPLKLEELYKPGPRRLRYIRRLYKDPIIPDGK
jgi:type II secretory pathway pseudopilin PulG